MPSKLPNLPIIGGVLAAMGAGLCCAGPLVLLLVGISGSWIGSLTLLAPYNIYFVIATFTLFGVAGWQLYRPIEACTSDTACAIPEVRKRRQIAFWVSAVLALSLVTSKYWIIWFA
ncbi:MAG: mercury transporter [Alteromonadaceae bacterium]|nr:MAG: mercury transporter [Alteromonadaceae bacterium]